MVPANGEVIVTIRLAPTTLRTAVDLVPTSHPIGAEDVSRARHGFPSVARDRAIAAMYASDGGDVRDVGRLVDGTAGGGAPPGSAPFRSRRGAKGSDPGGDALTEYVTSAGRRFTRAEYAATFALEDGARDTGTDTDEKRAARARNHHVARAAGIGPGTSRSASARRRDKDGTDDSGGRRTEYSYTSYSF